MRYALSLRKRTADPIPHHCGNFPVILGAWRAIVIFAPRGDTVAAYSPIMIVGAWVQAFNAAGMIDTNAQPRQGAFHAVDNPHAFPDEAFALAIRPLGVLFGKRRNARHAAVAPLPS